MLVQVVAIRANLSLVNLQGVRPKQPMAILPQHLSLYEDIFGLPGFLTEPILIFGFQDFEIPNWLFKPPWKRTFAELIIFAKDFLRRGSPWMVAEQYRAP